MNAARERSSRLGALTQLRGEKQQRRDQKDDVDRSRERRSSLRPDLTEQHNGIQREQDPEQRRSHAFHVDAVDREPPTVNPARVCRSAQTALLTPEVLFLSYLAVPGQQFPWRLGACCRDTGWSAVWLSLVGSFRSPLC